MFKKIGITKIVVDFVLYLTNFRDIYVRVASYYFTTINRGKKCLI
jgi:hypothetical protein